MLGVRVLPGSPFSFLLLFAQVKRCVLMPFDVRHSAITKDSSPKRKTFCHPQHRSPLRDDGLFVSTDVGQMFLNQYSAVRSDTPIGLIVDDHRSMMQRVWIYTPAALFAAKAPQTDQDRATGICFSGQHFRARGRCC
jgi:hypothetical protein